MKTELDIDNKIDNYLKITGNLNNVFYATKALKNKNKITQNTGPHRLLYGTETWSINLLEPEFYI
jgi:hypothetical protein